MIYVYVIYIHIYIQPWTLTPIWESTSFHQTPNHSPTTRAVNSSARVQGRAVWGGTRAGEPTPLIPHSSLQGYLAHTKLPFPPGTTI